MRQLGHVRLWVAGVQPPERLGGPAVQPAAATGRQGIVEHVADEDVTEAQLAVASGHSAHDARAGSLVQRVVDRIVRQALEGGDAELPPEH